MPRESSVREARRRLHAAGPAPHTPRPPGGRRDRLQVVDVALFGGERGGAIRTYLDAKALWAQRCGLIDHHVIVPGARRRHEAGPDQLPSSAVAYRLALGTRAVKDALRELRPHVVALHDPFCRPLGLTRAAHDVGAAVVAVHHGTIALDAAGLPGPDALWRPVLRSWMQRAYREADAVMSAVDPRPDCGRGVTIPLRFGIGAEFVPQSDVRRRDHVLYVGSMGRGNAVLELLQAAARSEEPWPLKLVGCGPIERHVPRIAQQLGVRDRVRIYPFVCGRERLARWYAGARVVVMPGAHETFGLVALEAAATGTPVVTCSTAPSAALMPALARTYAPGDIDGLLTAIETARAARPAAAAGDALGRRFAWGAALAAETLALERLVYGRRRLTAVAA